MQHRAPKVESEVFLRSCFLPQSGQKPKAEINNQINLFTQAGNKAARKLIKYNFITAAVLSFSLTKLSEQRHPLFKCLVVLVGLISLVALIFFLLLL